MLIVLIALLYWNITTARDRRREKLRERPALRDSAFRRNIIGLSLADAAAIGLLVDIFVRYASQWYTKLCYVLLGLLVEALLVGLLTQWLTDRRFFIWCAACLLAFGGLIGSTRYEAYLRDITVPEHFDYATYTPFAPGTLAAAPEETPTLRFTDSDHLPVMDGATALYPVYAAFAQAVYPDTLAALEPWEIRRTVACSTTSVAYSRIVDGECDIIFVAGPSDEQTAYAAQKGVQLTYTPIGREAFVFFVHPDNPLDGLTRRQLHDIYAGGITRWDQLGVGGLGRILAYQREKGSGSQTALERFVMRGTPLMPADKETRVGDMGSIVETVSAYKNHRNAIGFSFRFYCTALMKNFGVKLLAVDGVEPTVPNIENGAYPLASDFYAVTRSDADQTTLALLDWIRGPQGQALVKKAGYTPVN